jgi:hypothetical protein
LLVLGLLNEHCDEIATYTGEDGATTAAAAAAIAAEEDTHDDDDDESQLQSVPSTNHQLAGSYSNSSPLKRAYSSDAEEYYDSDSLVSEQSGATTVATSTSIVPSSVKNETYREEDEENAGTSRPSKLHGARSSKQRRAIGPPKHVAKRKKSNARGATSALHTASSASLLVGAGAAGTTSVSNSTPQRLLLPLSDGTTSSAKGSKPLSDGTTSSAKGSKRTVLRIVNITIAARRYGLDPTPHVLGLKRSLRAIQYDASRHVLCLTIVSYASCCASQH